MSKIIECPRCHKVYEKGKGALPRTGNEKEICPDCGTLEAFSQWEKVLNKGGVKNV